MRVRVMMICAGLLGAAIALADELPATTGATSAAVQPADPALRRPGVSVPPAMAGRLQPERRRCRDQAARRKLFGLARHKFLLRCRAAHRAGTELPQPR